MSQESSVLERISIFRALHVSGSFVIPNPWNPGTATYLEQLGFRALATSSGAFAFSRGLPDAGWALPVDVMIEHIRDIVEATALPVTADFQSGYARDLDELDSNVRACVATGVAGLSIEDRADDTAGPLFPLSDAVERVRSARRAIDASGRPVVLTARCEAFLVGVAQPLETVLQRLPAFAEAGADCLFAPGLSTPEQIEQVVRAVAPKPVNVIISAPQPGLTVASLSQLGVRRISIGSAAARAAWAAFIAVARELKDDGTFAQLRTATPYAELNRVFSRRRSNA